MDDSRLDTIVDVVRFLNGSEKTTFTQQRGTETYKWVEETLLKFRYAFLKKRDRGMLKRYIQKITGYSRSQVTRLITQFVQTGEIRIKEYERQTFIKRYCAFGKNR